MELEFERRFTDSPTLFARYRRSLEVCQLPAVPVQSSARGGGNPWHLRQRRQFRICNLLILKELTGFDSHPLRQ